MMLVKVLQFGIYLKKKREKEKKRIIENRKLVLCFSIFLKGAILCEDWKQLYSNYLWKV